QLDYRRLTHAADLVETERVFDQLRSHEQDSITYEKRYRRKDGSSFWALVTDSLVTNVNDNQPSYIVAVIEDISAQKRSAAAEHELRLLTETLYDTAIRLTSTLNLDEVLDLVLSSLRRVLPHDAATIRLVENDMTFTARMRGFVELG